jgi:hypothetical protein
MMAWEWSVYPRLSGLPMVAAGIADEPEQAHGEVEAALGASELAGWGTLQQVRVELGDPGHSPVSVWPAAERMPLACRRDGKGGYVWLPMTPVTV